MKWNEELEQQLITYKKDGKSFNEIAVLMNTTISSVKHKYNRLKQKENANEKHHPVEKIAQLDCFINKGEIRKVLETHGGYGNLTKYYSGFAKEVLTYETNKDKCQYISDMLHDNVTVHCKDSLREMYYHCYRRHKFDLIDVDPYGMPSRYLEMAVDLIDNGMLVITFPKYGVQQINEITKLHLKSFYGFNGGTNEEYKQHIIDTLQNIAIKSYKLVTLLDVQEIDRIYRFIFRVKQGNAFAICGYNHLLKQAI